MKVGQRLQKLLIPENLPCIYTEGNWELGDINLEAKATLSSLIPVYHDAMFMAKSQRPK